MLRNWVHVCVASGFGLLGCSGTRSSDISETTAELNGHPVIPGSGYDTLTVKVEDAQGGCTGTLIGDKVVLTAAHCICGGSRNPFLGCVKMANVTLWNGVKYSNMNVTIHPDYSMNWSATFVAYTNDFGAIFLSTSAQKQGATTAPVNPFWYPTEGTLETMVGLGDADGAGQCDGGFQGKQFGSGNIDDVDDLGEEGIDLYTSGFVHVCHGDSGGAMFNVNTEVIGVISRGYEDEPISVSASTFGEQAWFAALPHLSNRIKILDFAPAEPPTASVYTDRTPDGITGQWLDAKDDQIVGDFAKLGYDQLLMINKGPTGTGRIYIGDYRDGTGPTEATYFEMMGQSAVLDTWIDPGDRAIAGDFMGHGASQAMFINTNPGGKDRREGRLMIGSFYEGAPPVKVWYREDYSEPSVIDEFIDAEDVVVAGDFRNLGHDQAMFVNRTAGAAVAHAGRVVITDFSSGVAPSELKYGESYGDSPALDEMTDPGDRMLVGDFMGLGWDQAMFINMDSKRAKGAPFIRIVDFNNGNDFGKVRYAENVGDRTTLEDFVDPEDVQVAGNFLDLEPLSTKADQVMFINNSVGPNAGKSYIRLQYFFKGDVNNVLTAYDESIEFARVQDPNLSDAANVLSRRFDPLRFVVRAGNFRGRQGNKGRGHVQVMSALKN